MIPKSCSILLCIVKKFEVFFQGGTHAIKSEVKVSQNVGPNSNPKYTNFKEFNSLEAKISKL